jgi:acyl-CoA thioester hydrolase
MRHTAYNDYAAESRVRLFDKYGLSLAKFNALSVGPVLFKEETNFFREISMGEDIKVEVLLKGASEGGERFKFSHRIVRSDGVVAAEIEVYGAWIDLNKRRLANELPDLVRDMFLKMPRSDQFEEIELKKR